MLTNPGFTFYGIPGKHEILPIEKTDLPAWGALYKDAIVCTSPGDIVKIYNNGPGYDWLDTSIAVKFASINPSDTVSILDFCNKYGMPFSSRQAANFRNDYLFLGEDKHSFSMKIPTIEKHDRIWLFTVQRAIVQMKQCVALNEAIKDKDYCKIIDILLYFCFDLCGLDFNTNTRITETFQFNQAFNRFAKEHDSSKASSKVNMNLHDLIETFLDDVYLSYIEITQLNTKAKHPAIMHQTWQNLHQLFFWLSEQVTICDISPFAEITYSKPLQNIIPLISEEERIILLRTAKAVCSDIFKENLHSVHPEFIYSNDGKARASWNISHLLEAMYLELFFRYSPTSDVRKCKNPTCLNYFIYSNSHPKKIYCSESCAICMAKRKQRAREKQAKNK